MADLTAPRPVNALGGIAGNLVLPPVLTAIGPGVAAATTIYSGAIIGYDASGNLVNGDAAACVYVAGIARKNYINTTTATPPTSGLAGAINGEVLVGPYSCLGDGTVTASTAYGTDLFVVDNQTVSTSDQSATGGTRLRAGYFVTLDPNSNPVVMFGVASPTGRAAGTTPASTAVNKARFVFTSLGANTGSGTGQLTITATGALAAQDGVTPAVGDVAFIQEGTTNLAAAKDAGPWVVTNPGATGVSPVLTRPDWWSHGQGIVQGTIINVGGEGTGASPQLAGTEWKTFAAKGKVVDTDAPVFWPGRMVSSVTLAASTATITNMPVKSATATGIPCNLNAVGGTTTSTVAYGPIAPPTAGVTGSASIVIDAIASGQTKNGTSDTSIVTVTVINW